MTVRKIVLPLILLLLAACAPARPTPAPPVPSSMPAPTMAAATAMPSQAPAPTATAVATVVQVSPTVSAVATATPNPPPQTQTLQNAEIGYRMTYDPQMFTPEMPGILPHEVSGLRLTAPLGETLESAYLLVTLEPTTNWHQCLDTPPQAEVGTLESTPLGDRRVNGEGYRGYDVVLPVFVDSTFFDRQFRAYHMQTSRCVTVHLLLHAERPADQVSDQDKQAAWARLMQVFASMTWTE